MSKRSVVITSMLSASFASPLALVHPRSLLPNVTIKALPSGCASYPGYNPDTKTAGPWSLTVSHAENPLLENFGPGSAYSLGIGREGAVMQWGYMTLNRGSDVARTAHQCTHDTLQALVDTRVDDDGNTFDAQFVPIVLSPEPHDATVRWLVEGEQPTVYEHYIGEEKQPGWFLGGYDTTTWGVKWTAASSTSYDEPYFYLRLLPTGQGLQVNETKVFLKFQA